MEKDAVLQRLCRLDEDVDLLFEDERRFHMILVGGSALILLDVLSRATQDIDAIQFPRELSSLLEKYDINGHVATYVNNFPYNFEDRAVPIFRGRRVDFFTASLEDIVIAKLFSNRDSDARDVEQPGVLRALDWARLERLANDDEEVRNNALNDRDYNTFRYHYDEYVGRFRPCAN